MSKYDNPYDLRDYIYDVYYSKGRRPRLVKLDPKADDFSTWTFWEPWALLYEMGYRFRVYHPLRSTVEGNHAKLSYHYRGLAIDLVGSPQEMASAKAFLAPYAQGGGRQLDELIFNDRKLPNYYKGHAGGKIAPNHYDHIHIAMRPDVHILKLADTLRPLVADGGGSRFLLLY